MAAMKGGNRKFSMNLYHPSQCGWECTTEWRWWSADIKGSISTQYNGLKSASLRGRLWSRISLLPANLTIWLQPKDSLTLRIRLYITSLPFKATPSTKDWRRIFFSSKESFDHSLSIFFSLCNSFKLSFKSGNPAPFSPLFRLSLLLPCAMNKSLF